jgi:hypothetical protein
MGPALAIQQNIRRLQVAMEKASLVSVMDRARECGQQKSGRVGIVRAALLPLQLDLACQAPTFDQLHAEKRAALELRNLEDRHDIGVVEIGG